MALFSETLLNGVFVGSTYAVVAVGFALVFSVMRVVNLAHPDFVVIGAFVAVIVTRSLTDNPLIVLAVVATATGIAGLLLERTVLRPLRTRGHLMPVVATAGVSVLLQNLLAGVFGSDPIPLSPIVPNDRYDVLGLEVTAAEAFNVGISILIMIAVSLYVRRTRWGRATRAIAERPDVAAAFGVNVNRISQMTVALASMTAGVAGVAIANLYTSAWAFAGGVYALKAFTCMLVAGNRHTEGVMIVALSLGVLEALVTVYVSSTYRDAVAFVVLIVVLFFRPNGLFGSYGEYS